MFKQFIEASSPKTKSLKLLYGLIRKLGPVRINTLSELTGYKPLTCTRLLDEMVQEGLIYDSGIGESSGGRKPMMYVIKPDAYYLIGVQITDIHTTVLLLDLNLETIDSRKLLMKASYTGEYSLDFISQSVDELLEAHMIQKEKLLGVGVGLMEPKEKELEVQTSHFIESWQGLNVVEYLQKKIHVPVSLDNPTNLAALAEYRKNYWQKTDHLVFVSNDFGIRCGAIFQGKLVSHKAEMDNGFSHMVVDLHGRRCECGTYGCLQAYSSLPAIRDEAVRQLKRGRASSLHDQVNNAEEVKFSHILDALKSNDPLCSEVVNDAAYYFGIGLSNLIFLLRPDVVICGDISVPQPYFYEKAAETAQNRLKQYPNSPIEIKASTSAQNMVAKGAGCMVLDAFTMEK